MVATAGVAAVIWYPYHYTTSRFQKRHLNALTRSLARSNAARVASQSDDPNANGRNLLVPPTLTHLRRPLWL
jgi:hypothetical protein